MARNFTNDVIRFSIGACNITHPHTWAGIVRRNEDGTGHVIFAVDTVPDGADPVLRFRLEGANTFQYQVDGAGSSSAFTVVAADGWVLLAAKKATGTVAPRVSKFVYSTQTWTHENLTARADNTLPGAGGEVRFARGNEASNQPWRGDMLLQGFWNVVLSDSEVESLPYSLAHWFKPSAVGLWLLDQASTGQTVIDLTGGGANQSAIIGTTVATNHPKFFSRGHPVIKMRPGAAAAPPAAGGHRLALLGVGR